MPESRHDQVMREYAATISAINALDASIGNKPWNDSVSWPRWRNPYPAGTAEYAALQEIRKQALKLDARRKVLGAELDVLREEQIAKNLAASRVLRADR